MPNQPPVSLEDLDYTQRTAGWMEILLPFWQKNIEKIRERVKQAEKKMLDNESGNVKYELGFLNGYEMAMKAPEFILKGVKLRQSRNVGVSEATSNFVTGETTDGR